MWIDWPKNTVCAASKEECQKASLSGDACYEVGEYQPDEVSLVNGRLVPDKDKIALKAKKEPPVDPAVAVTEMIAKVESKELQEILLFLLNRG